MRFEFILISIIFIFFISCVTSPDTKTKEVSRLREKVLKYDLKRFAKAEFDLAEKNYNEVQSLIQKKNNFKVDKMLDEVNKNYQKVLDVGLPPYTEERNDNSKKQKGFAEVIKANVAVKSQYNEAESTYNEAVASKEKKDYEKAIELFNKAEEQFKNCYTVSKEKKDKAEISINKTEDAFKEMENTDKELQKRLKEIEEMKAKEMSTEGETR